MKTADEMFLECGYNSCRKERNGTTYYSALYAIYVDKDGVFKERLGGFGTEILCADEALAYAKWIEEWRSKNGLD